MSSSSFFSASSSLVSRRVTCARQGAEANSATDSSAICPVARSLNMDAPPSRIGSDQYPVPVATAMRRVLAPPVGVSVESLSLDAHDAEALSARCAHDDPALQALVDRSPEFLEPRDFSGNVVGFDVEMNATLVVDALDLYADLARRRFEHHIVAAGARVIRINGPAQRFGPEARRRFDILDIAVNQDSVHSGTVHRHSHS